MEFSWPMFLTSFSICLFIRALFTILYRSNQVKLPPGPPNIPIFSTLQLVRKGLPGLEPTLRGLFFNYGPIVLLRIGSQKAIFIRSPELAYKALITYGSTFADRPPSTFARLYLSCNQHSIHTAAYGPLWRVLRRNLTSEILHSSRIKSYAHARKQALDILCNQLKQESLSGTEFVCAGNHFRYAIFCLLVFMCFGDDLDNGVIKQVESSESELMITLGKFEILDSLPKFLSKIVFSKRWNLLYKLRSKQEGILIPLIRARKQNKNKGGVAYVDTLLNLSLPEEKEGRRKLSESETVTLCSEFLNAGRDTVSTALEWIMANLVKHRDIQAKLYEEINANTEQGEIKTDDLHKMPYLKAVVLEGLRRHPPAHFAVPHAVTEDSELEGYVVPKDAMVNFMMAEMGRDPKVWEEPMEFRPERFLGEVFDVSGSREIKMMPFGAGRRICPAYGFAILHLEYFVANLIKEFEWTSGKGDGVNLSESLELVVVMENPLESHLIPRQLK